MKVEILRIEQNIVNCRLEDGMILDIDRKWFPQDIKEADEIDFDVAIANQ